MGKFDQDRHQKELAIRYCLARKMAPCPEVIVSSSSDLSSSIEVLTDLDVLGLEFVVDGGFRRTIFDCKTGKMSSINRAFWASGVLNYTGCDEAMLILKTRAVDNHRISALRISVDLHDENSLRDLGRTYDQAFDHDLSYQSGIGRWHEIYEIYLANKWTEPLYNLGRNLAPLSNQPWSVFRRLIAELRGARGLIDPAKDKHCAIYIDVLASMFILWSTMGKDVRRFYQPTMKKEQFESLLRYYIWGGRETYNIRQELAPRDDDGRPRVLELPSWEKLLSFAGIMINAPQELFGCVNICRSMSIRLGCGKNSDHDAALSVAFGQNKRARQFIMSLNDYLISACGLPRDLGDRVNKVLGEI